VTINVSFITALCMGWLLSTAAIAQEVVVKQPTGNFKHMASTQAQPNDVGVVGAVQKVVAKSQRGVPAGVHLFLSSPQGIVDANLGPYLSKDVQQSLKAAQSVQVVGVSQTIHGQTYLLAKQLIFSGRLVTIRNEHGFLVRSQVSDTSPRHNGRNDLNGGNQ
jgi:hypothetical protein